MTFAMLHDMSEDTKTQLQEAAPPRGLCSGQLHR